MQGRRRTSRGRRAVGTALTIPAILVAAAMSVAAQTPSLPGPYQVEADSVRVVYWGDARPSAERTLQAARTPMPLPGLGGTTSLRRGTILLAPSPELFDSLTFGATPDWAAGVAIPAQRIIVLPAFERATPFGDAAVTLRHELAHLALTDYLGFVPARWFDEGYATWVSGGWDARTGWQIRLALLGGNLPPLDSLTLSWPAREGRARLAYLLSASAVVHLANSRGMPAFEAFMEAWRREGSIDPAMRETYLLTLTQYEREWRGMVRRRYGWLLALSQLSAFWIGVGVLVFVLGIRRRRRNRERMAELRREEYMLPPGPPVDPGTDPT